MRVDIPDSSLLTEMAPMAATLKGRVVIFHYPTHTILEFVGADDPGLESVSPRHEWQRIDQYGQVDDLAVHSLCHWYITDDLTAVFEQTWEWYECRTGLTPPRGIRNLAYSNGRSRRTT